MISSIIWGNAPVIRNAGLLVVHQRLRDGLLVAPCELGQRHLVGLGVVGRASVGVSAPQPFQPDGLVAEDLQRGVPLVAAHTVGLSAIDLGDADRHFVRPHYGDLRR
jgi:hypothetical protein